MDIFYFDSVTIKLYPIVTVYTHPNPVSTPVLTDMHKIVLTPHSPFSIPSRTLQLALIFFFSFY